MKSSLTFLLLMVAWLAVPQAVAQAPQRSALYIDSAQAALAWDEPSPALPPTALRQALARTLPPAAAVLPLNLESSLETRQASVAPGLTRRQALEQIVPPGAVLLVFAGSVVVTRGQLFHASAAQAARAPAPASSAAPGPVSAVPQGFDVEVSDRTLRSTLERWARQAGWAFANGFWTLPRDLPVLATARYGSDFKAAVADLLRATDLTDQPAKPCFYSNHVLRVVARAEACGQSINPP